MVAERIFELCGRLEWLEKYDVSRIDKVLKAADGISKSASGSWLGYHSRVYYKDLNQPPPGAHFSQEWGFMDWTDTRGEWAEYLFEDIVRVIYEESGENNRLEDIKPEVEKAVEVIEAVKYELMSIMHSMPNIESDAFTKKLIENIEKNIVLTADVIKKYMAPSGQIMTRDMAAMEKGIICPPHASVCAAMMEMKNPFVVGKKLRADIIKLASHMRNIEKKQVWRSEWVQVFL